MHVSKAHILDRLRRVKGPDLEGNIVDLGLVSDILIKEDRVYFSITVPASRAGELESLRQAAEKVVREVEGVGGVVAVLTAENKPGDIRPSNVHEHPRVREARKRGMAGDGGNGQTGPGAAPGLELLEDRGHVELHRVARDAESRGDRLVPEPVGHHPEDLDLARRERTVLRGRREVAGRLA